ncbi:MAG: hypothetical protein ABFE13_05105 [Phycisphaerales bacterium]
MTHPRRRLILAAVSVAAFLVWRLCWSPALYRMTILPSLGGLNTHVGRLNDNGQVIGLVYDKGGRTRHFLWDRSDGIQDLGFANAWNVTINNAGQITGTMRTDPNSEEAFLWEPGKGRTMLGTLGGKRSIAYAMNNRGQIIGVSLDANDFLHAFLWDKQTGMKRLPVPDGIRCIPYSINDAGQILVMAIKQPLVIPGPWFLLDPNGSEPVDSLPPDMWLLSMNAGSCIIAIQHSGSPKSYLLFRDEQGVWRRLFHMHEVFTPQLNDSNQVAYTERVYNRWDSLQSWLPRWLVRPRLPSHQTRSYLWDPVRGRVPLNRYLKGMERFYVEDLNNNGCIVGSATTEDGNPCSVLLEPIPERWGK